MYFFRPLSTISRYSGRAHGDGGQEVAKYIARGKPFFWEKPARSLYPLVQLVQGGRWEVELVEAQLSSLYPLAQAGKSGLIADDAGEDQNLLQYPQCLLVLQSYHE